MYAQTYGVPDMPKYGSTTMSNRIASGSHMTLNSRNVVLIFMLPFSRIYFTLNIIILSFHKNAPYGSAYITNGRLLY